MEKGTIPLHRLFSFCRFFQFILLEIQEQRRPQPLQIRCVLSLDIIAHSTQFKRIIIPKITMHSIPKFKRIVVQRRKRFNRSIRKDIHHGIIDFIAYTKTKAIGKASEWSASGALDGSGSCGIFFRRGIDA